VGEFEKSPPAFSLIEAFSTVIFWLESIYSLEIKIIKTRNDVNKKSGRGAQ
jgi:hypothetical protein